MIVTVASPIRAQICSFVEEGVKRWHRVRTSHWRRDAPACNCGICADPARLQKYLDASRSTSHLRKALLPCGETAFPEYSIGDATFKAFNGLCCLRRCPKRPFILGAPPRGPNPCGWDFVFGADCPLEATDDEFTWWRWEPRLRCEKEDDKGETKKYYSDEWVPHKGTRREFLAECAAPCPSRHRPQPRPLTRRAHAARRGRSLTPTVLMLWRRLRRAVEAGGNPWLYHTWRHKYIRHAIKLHESRKDGVTATEWSDYAAQPEIRRAKTATCANAEKVNELVTVVGYKPYDATVEALHTPGVTCNV